MSATFPSVCPRCSAPLSTGADRCARCGFIITPYQQGHAGFSPSSHNPAWQTIPEQQDSLPGWSHLQTAPLHNPPRPVYPSVLTSPEALHAMPPEGQIPSPPVAKRRGKNKLSVGIVVLLVLLVGGGLLLWLLPHQNSAGTSAQAHTYPTPKETPLVTETFKDNTQQWNLQSEPGKYKMAIDKGSLTLEDEHNKLLPLSLPGGKTFDNFVLMVNASLTRGDQMNGYGVYIRAATDEHGNLISYYRFALYGDGSYAIFKGETDANGNTSATTLVPYTGHAAIQAANHDNQIVITANGPAMTLIVNGETIKTITDRSYPAGSAGLFVSNVQNARPGVQAKFSHLAVYPVQKQQQK